MNKSITAIPSQTMGALTQYDWPGNVRELQNVIERAVILSTHGVLHVPAADLKARGSAAAKNELATTRSSHKRIRAVVPPLSREQVVQALKEAGGRVGGPDGAADRLGLKRTTLIAQMKRLGIDPQTVTNR